MKRYLSVFAMLARSSLGRVLFLLVLMAAGQCCSFYCRLRNELVLYETQDPVSGAGVFEPSHLEDLIGFTTVWGFFGAAFLLVCIVLCLPGCGYGANCGYTLRRLRISERSVFVLQTVCNVMMLVLLWAAEVAVCLLLCRIYVTTVPASLVSHQTAALAFYRDPFLHALLPLADITVWIRNGIMILVLALTAASFPYKQRRGRFASDIVSYAILTVIFFVRAIGDGFNTFITVFFGLILAAEAIYYVWFKNGEEDDDDGQTA